MNLYTSEPWLYILSKAFRIQEILPGFFAAKLKLGFSDKYISLPFSDYSMIITHENINEQINMLKTLDTPIKIKYLFSPTYRDLSFPSQSLHLYSETSEYIKKTRSSSAQRAINKAKKNVAIEILSSAKDCNSFFESHQKYSYEKFKRVPIPRSITQEIYPTFKDNIFIVRALDKYSNNIASEIFLIAHQDILYYRYGWSNQSYLKLRPNNLSFHSLCSGSLLPKYKLIDLGHNWKNSEKLLYFKRLFSTLEINSGYMYFPGKARKEVFNKIFMALIRLATKAEVSLMPLHNNPTLSKLHKYCC